MSKLKGHCMCGQISYDSESEPGLTAVCHCPDCQRQTGTAFSIVVALPEAEIKVNGQPKIYTTTGETGQAVNRHFCGDCGSPLWSQVDAMPGMVFLKAGTLDDTSWLEPQAEMFCDTAQSWVSLVGEWGKVPRNPDFG